MEGSGRLAEEPCSGCSRWLRLSPPYHQNAPRQGCCQPPHARVAHSALLRRPCQDAIRWALSCLAMPHRLLAQGQKVRGCSQQAQGWIRPPLHRLGHWLKPGEAQRLPGPPPAHTAACEGPRMFALSQTLLLNSDLCHRSPGPGVLVWLGWAKKGIPLE